MTPNDSGEHLEPGFLLRIWRRFRRMPLAWAGVAALAFLFLPALFAPFLANGRPFLLWLPDQGWSSPFWRYFFHPDTTELFIEQLFNYLLLSAVVMLILYPLKWRWKWLLPVILILPFLLVKAPMDKTNFRQLVAQTPNSRAIFAPIPYSATEIVTTQYAPPSREHWFGGDDIGRDLTSGMIYGGRVSLAVGLLATLAAMIIGTLVGLTSGYIGGHYDLAMMRIVEVLICFPTFLLLLVIMSIFKDWKFDQSILVVIVVIGATGWMGLSRLVRGEVLKIKTLPYIQATVVAGISQRRIYFVHLLPNVLAPILISGSFAVAGAILAESSLSFLGFGIQPPTPSWGALMRQAFSDPFAYWHLTLIPGLALFIAVVGFNFVGEALRKSCMDRV